MRMDPFDLEMEKLELEDIIRRAKVKKEAVVQDRDLRKSMLLQSIIINALKRIESIEAYEQEFFGNVE